jgi:transcriptional regulator with XRE-family HTH domain
MNATLDRETLLFADEEALGRLSVPDLENAEAALNRLEKSGAGPDARRYVEPCLAWLDVSLREIFGPNLPERIRLEAGAALLRAPLTAWRHHYPGHSLLLTLVDNLRDIALDYGIEAKPLRASHVVIAELAASGLQTMPTTMVLDVIFHEYLRSMGADLTLRRIAEVFDLNNTELGVLFGVTRQAVDQWRTRGIPPERRADVDRIREIAELYNREFLPERIPQIVRRPVEALNGRTALEALAKDGPGAVREYLGRTFAFLAA